MNQWKLNSYDITDWNLHIQKGRRGKSCPLTAAIIKRLILRAWVHIIGRLEYRKHVDEYNTEKIMPEIIVTKIINDEED